jgi:hypothetical protein
MGPVALTAALVAAVVAAVTLLVVSVALVRATRTTRAERERLDHELSTSRGEVAELSRRVAELSAEVTATRQDRDYVITSLAGDAASSDREGAGAHPRPDEAALLPYDEERDRPSVGQVVEDQLVGMLARQDGSWLRARAVDVVVRTVALGHGVRRALSPDVLDRAAAEAHVARRRSRRDRRRELREARRLVRGSRQAADPDRAAGRREDAA